MELEDRIREIVESGVNDEGFEKLFSEAVAGRGSGNDDCDKDEKATSPVEDLEETSLENRVSEIMEEDAPSFGGDDIDGRGDGSSEGLEHDDSGDEVKKSNDDEKPEEEEFKADDFDDFMEKTGTKVKIQKVACEPSPIFGPDDVSRHNKFKVTLTNEKGSVWIYFWDSTKNTESGDRSSVETMTAEFGRGCKAVKDG